MGSKDQIRECQPRKNNENCRRSSKANAGADPGAGLAKRHIIYIYIYIYRAHTPAQTKKRDAKNIKMISMKNTKTIIKQTKNNKTVESGQRRRPPGADLPERPHLEKGLKTWPYIYIYIYLYVCMYIHVYIYIYVCVSNSFHIFPLCVLNLFNQK